MRLFVAGFLSCYMLGAVYTGVMLSHMEFETAKVYFNAATWPALLARLANAPVTFTHN